MRSASGRSGNLAAIAAALVIALAGSAALAQGRAPAENLAGQLAPSQSTPEIDLAALRQQATERIKSKATAAPVNRPPMVPELLKAPQVTLDVLFDPDSSIIRPGSYATLGRIADALTQPGLLPYRFLIVGHTESGGRRDHNVTISQRRADAIRDALVTTFKLSPKRLQSLGLGEEQLRDAARPAAASNRRIQIVNIGELPAESPASPPPVSPKTQAKSKSGRPPR
jgi:OOP family OmpA-OmpF porin